MLKLPQAFLVLGNLLWIFAGFCQKKDAFAQNSRSVFWRGVLAFQYFYFKLAIVTRWLRFVKQQIVAKTAVSPLCKLSK